MGKKNRPPAVIEDKRPEGRPPHQPTALTRQLVTRAAGMRMTQEQIALGLGVAPKTLTLHYQEELNAGKAIVSMTVANAAIKRIEAGDTALIKFLLINELGFKEASEIHVKDDKPSDTLGIPDFNRWIAEINAKSRTLNHAPSSQNRPLLPIEVSAEPEGHGKRMVVPTLPGSPKGA